MISYILIVICVIFSYIFSGSEIAFASSSELKLRKKAEEEKRLDVITYYIKNKYDDALVSILIGNNLVNIASSAMATIIAMKIMGDKGVGTATLIMTIVIIIFGEITPKILASKAPETFARSTAYVIRVIMFVSYPIVLLTRVFLKAVHHLWKEDISNDEVTEDDLETIIDTVEEEGVIDEDTADLLQNAIDFNGVQAYEIITHRVDTDGLDIEDSDEKNIAKLMNTLYSRLPVYKASLDETLGYVVVDECLKAMVDGNFEKEKFIREPVFVFKTTGLDDVLDIMRKENCHMVFVTDEYGGTMGIITMEDVLEQIVGQIWDEKDIVEEDIEEVKEDTYDVLGDTRIEDVFDELDFEDKDFSSDNATVGGWAIEMLGDYPSIGDSFDYKNLHFIITDMDEMRVKELRVKVNEINKNEE